MKSIFKHTKAALIALLAMLMCITMAFGLAACNNTSDDGDDNTDPVITKYDATFDASIVMGAMGSQSFESVFSSAYITKKDGKYTLTAIFTAGELKVGAATGTIFVDDNPTTTTETDGTLGAYDANGNLVTNGVVVTYSSGDNYVANPAQENVYYVQSVAFPVDGLRATYELSMYINSNMMGAQFNKELFRVAKITLDLESGEVVNAITGLGVATRGEAPQPIEEKYTKYGATLDGKVAMGPQEINFTENLLDGAYVIKKGEKHEITLIFKTGEVSIFTNKMTAFLTTAETEGYGGKVTPVYGYYVDETLVTEGITLTYSDGNNYVTNKNGSYYYVQSMTFTVDELEDSYSLSIYVLAGNETSVSGMQFPYTLSNGGVSKAILTLDLTDTETVESIDDLLGVDTLGEAPQPQPEYAYTKYDATLSAVVTAMNIDFGSGLLAGAYVSEENGQYYLTLIFNYAEITIFGSPYRTFVDDAPEGGGSGKGVQDGTIGFYDSNGELVTSGVKLTYSSGDDYATNSKSNKVYYVKSATFPVDSLRTEYKFAFYVNSSVMGAQFCEANDNATGTTYSASVTLDLESGAGVDSIDDLLGVETRGEVPAAESISYFVDNKRLAY